MKTLLEVRERLALTPEEFALLLGVSESVVLLIEMGPPQSAQSLLGNAFATVMFANLSLSTRTLIEERLWEVRDVDERERISVLRRKLAHVA